MSAKEMVLLANPFVIGLTMAILARVYEHLARREFNMRWLAEQRRMEVENYAEQLEVVNRDLEHFAGIASHELQQPLVTVNWWLGLVSSQLKDRDLLVGSAADYLANAEATVSHMNGLIARLLTYSELNAGELVKESVDLNAVFTQGVSDLDALVNRSGATATADPLPTVDADRYLLGEVLQNLIENAIKYAHPDRKPTVHVSAEENPLGWKITVSDNGMGIDPAHVDTIFAPHSRLHTAGNERGAGLGLATCRKIMHLHGGAIGVEPGQTGSTFWFTIPKQ
jgi:light-regulated signal transduction histidine kinase (bacteriophytochrome)